MDVKAGDYVKCISETEGYTVEKEYQVLCVDSDSGDLLIESDDENEDIEFEAAEAEEFFEPVN